MHARGKVVTKGGIKGVRFPGREGGGERGNPHLGNLIRGIHHPQPLGLGDGAAARYRYIRVHFHSYQIARNSRADASGGGVALRR